MTPLVLPGTTTTSDDTKKETGLPTWAIITISVLSGLVGIVAVVLGVVYGGGATEGADASSFGLYEDRANKNNKTRDFIRCNLLNDCLDS